MSKDKDWDDEDENTIDQDEHEEATHAARWPDLEEEPDFKDEKLEKEIGDMIWAILPGKEKTPLDEDT